MTNDIHFLNTDKRILVCKLVFSVRYTPSRYETNKLKRIYSIWHAILMKISKLSYSEKKRVHSLHPYSHFQYD